MAKRSRSPKPLTPRENAALLDRLGRDADWNNPTALQNLVFAGGGVDE